MTPLLTPETRRRLADLLAPFPAVSVYVADPGAVMVMEAVAAAVPAADGPWFADGWAAANLKRPFHPAAALSAALDRMHGGEAVLLGSQVAFATTRRVLRDCRARGVATVFLFDHWKNFAAHFIPAVGEPGGVVLPDRIGVPDAAAADLLRADFARHGLMPDRTPPVMVTGHPAVEAACARIRALPAAGTTALRRSLGAEGKPMVLFLLDPVERGGASDPGYGWEDIMDWLEPRAAGFVPGARILVKPHPRQSPERVGAVLERWRRAGLDAGLAAGGDTEALIAAADVVWGITTVALVTALGVGKPVRSFQIGRNAGGVLDSNPHIEPFTVTG